MYQKWFVKFHAGDSSLDTTPRSGRPLEVDRDQIETLTENYQCSTTCEIANTLKISNSIMLLVKMKKCVFCFMEKNGLFGQPNIFLEAEFK